MISYMADILRNIVAQMEIDHPNSKYVKEMKRLLVELDGARNDYHEELDVLIDNIDKQKRRLNEQND